MCKVWWASGVKIHSQSYNRRRELSLRGREGRRESSHLANTEGQPCSGHYLVAGATRKEPGRDDLCLVGEVNSELG